MHGFDKNTPPCSQCAKRIVITKNPGQHFMLDVARCTLPGATYVRPGSSSKHHMHPDIARRSDGPCGGRYFEAKHPAENQAQVNAANQVQVTVANGPVNNGPIWGQPHWNQPNQPGTICRVMPPDPLEPFITCPAIPFIIFMQRCDAVLTLDGQGALYNTPRGNIPIILSMTSPGQHTFHARSAADGKLRELDVFDVGSIQQRPIPVPSSALIRQLPLDANDVMAHMLQKFGPGVF